MLRQNSAPKSLTKFHNQKLQGKQNTIVKRRQRVNSYNNQHLLNKVNQKKMQIQRGLSEKNNFGNIIKRQNSQKFLTMNSEKANENKEIIQYKQTLRNQSRLEKCILLPTKVVLNEVVQKIQVLSLMQSESITYAQLLKFLFSMFYISFPTQQEYKTQASKQQLKKVYLLWISLLEKIEPQKHKNNQASDKCSLKRCKLINVIALPVNIEQVKASLQICKRKAKSASSKNLASFPSSQIDKLFLQQKNQDNRLGNDPQFIFFVQKKKFKFNEEGVALLQLQRQRIVNTFNCFIKRRISLMYNRSKCVSDFLSKLQTDRKQLESSNQKDPLTTQYQRQQEIQLDKEGSQEESDYNYYEANNQVFQYLENNQLQRNFVENFKRSLIFENKPINSQVSPRINNHLKHQMKLHKKERSRSRPQSEQKDLDLLILSRPKAKSRNKTSDQIEFQKEAKQYTFHPKVKQHKTHFNTKDNQQDQNLYRQAQIKLIKDSQDNSKNNQKGTSLNKIKDVQKTIMRMHQARNIKLQKQELQKKGWTRGSKIPQQDHVNKGYQKQRRKIVLMRNTSNDQQQKCFKKSKNVHLQNVGVTTSEVVSQRTTEDVVDRNCKNEELKRQVRKLLGREINSHEFSPKLKNEGQQKFDTFPQQHQERTQVQLKQLPIPSQVPASLRQKNQQFRIPILYIDVNIEQGKKQRIVIYDSDRACDLAQSFGKKHNLDAQTVERLQQMLQQQIDSVLARIDQQTQQDSFIG